AARWLGGERGAAGPAELLAWRDGGATARAGCLKPGATVLAETRGRVVLHLAPGTLHARASKPPRQTVSAVQRLHDGARCCTTGRRPLSRRSLCAWLSVRSDSWTLRTFMVWHFLPAGIRS